MKKCFSIFMTLLIMLSVGVIGASAYSAEHEAYTSEVYFNDFTTYPHTFYFQGMGYNIGSGLTGQTDNILTDFADGHAKVFQASMKKAGNGDGHYVTVMGNSNGTSAFSGITGKSWEVTLDVMVTAKARLDVSLRMGADKSKWFTPLRFMANGTMTDEEANLTEDGYEVNYGAYETNTWYSIKIYVDFAKNTYSLTVNGKALESNKPYTFGKDCIYDMYLGLSAATLTDEIVSGDNWMYLDNIRFATLEAVYGYSYTDDAGYQNVLISDDFEAVDINTNLWYTPIPASVSIAADPQGTRGNVAKLQGAYPRLYSGYNTAGQKPIAEQYTTEELGRVRIRADVYYDDPTTNGSKTLFNLRTYDAYNNKNGRLITFNADNPVYYPFGNASMQNWSREKSWVSGKWYTVTLYLDFVNGLGTAKASDGTNEYVLWQDYDLTQWDGYSGTNTRIDSVWIESGDSKDSGACYVDNVSYSVMAPQIKIAPTGDTTGTIYFTYAPDMYQKASAALIIAVKKADRLVKTEIVPLAARKLTAREVTGTYGATGGYAVGMSDDDINAYHTTVVSRHYTKAADETVEIYLWEGTAGLKPLRSAIR